MSEEPPIYYCEACKYEIDLHTDDVLYGRVCSCLYHNTPECAHTTCIIHKRKTTLAAYHHDKCIMCQKNPTQPGEMCDNCMTYVNHSTATYLGENGLGVKINTLYVSMIVYA